MKWLFFAGFLVLKQKLEDMEKRLKAEKKK